MAAPKRLVLFVEGEGDRDALPVLVKQLITEIGGWSDLFLDPKPFVVGTVADLTANNGRDWLRLLHAARGRGKLGAVLLVQDGDLGRIRGEDFCAAKFATRLGDLAKSAGAGKLFSVGIAFACMEFESWLLACAEQLAGVQLPDGRPGIRLGATGPTGHLEQAPRDAKGWLDQHIDAGYKPTRDQEQLTRLMIARLDAVRQRGMRSFRRLENALQQLVNALRADTHIVSPETSSSPSA
ncbi:MAG TPA: DUF4276 family protein [Gemmataceae bacterium]|nr:DUF4276 family protein [Gemmataceae bacterium]